MAEDGGDVEASGALDVHEERVGALHEALSFVLSLVEFLGRVEQIDIRLQHLHRVRHKSVANGPYSLKMGWIVTNI